MSTSKAHSGRISKKQMTQAERSDKRTVGIDLFCGAGGMTLGAEQAGIEVIYAVQKCPHAAATYHLNSPTIPTQVGDIRNERKLPHKPLGAGTVISCSPCEDFSTSNQWMRNRQNPNNRRLRL